MIIPSMLYDSESWVMNTREKRSLEVFDMKWLRGNLDGSTMHRIKMRDRRERLINNNRQVVRKYHEGPSIKVFG